MKTQRRDLAWLRQVSSFFSSRVILTANHYRIFEHLTGAGVTARRLASRLSLDPRATELLLNSLVAIGLLGTSGSRYRNRPVAARYLLQKSPAYQGDILRHYAALWENWSGLDTVLRTGRPHRVSRDHRSFILGMDNLAKLRVKELLASLDLNGVKRVLDLGGGPGTYAIAFAEKGCAVTLFDFPATLKISREVIAQSAARRMITLQPGDFVHDQIGSGYDLIFVSQILHAYAPADCVAMLRKCRAALNPGGQVIVQEFPLDESKTSPLPGALFAINMLVNTEGGRSYTPGEMSSWLKRAGFRGIQKRFTTETVLLLARAPRTAGSRR